MPEPPTKPPLSEVRILYEIVLYRYITEEGLELSGEASLMLERDEHSGLLRSLHVTLLSVFNTAGEEIYTSLIPHVALRKRLEIAAVEHYYQPAIVSIVLPKRIMEW